MEHLAENPFTWIYFPTALALGALHALEPGHAKTLTAAYLIGIKGTRVDALLLGLSVAFTHSIVVVGISVGALWLGRETFTQDVTRWLQIGSGIVVILLGLWMLIRRLGQMRAHHHHHDHEPQYIRAKSLAGNLSIEMTPNGERLQFKATYSEPNLKLRAIIERPEGLEILPMHFDSQAKTFSSEIAPREPHEFKAKLEIAVDEDISTIDFEMHEHEHDHDHSHMSDDEHARAHAASMPEYAKKGERPTLLQIIAFGAAGGMIPCPASITVMLLALSIGKFASGVLAVAGFSIGLAVTLVGIGLIVVAGISKLGETGKFAWFSAKAPVLSAAVVMLSGAAALIFVH